MRTKFFLLFLLLSFLLVTTTQAEEHYFKFKVDSKKELDKITKIISIDNVENGIVYAYANDKEMDNFRTLGYEITELQHPGTLIQAKSSSDLKEIADWNVYPTYSAYVAMMNKFEIDYPGLCEIVSIGTTNDGRELLFAKISDNVSVEEDEPEVMYTSSIHGDETTGSVLMLRMIDSLLSNYGVVAEITGMVDSMEIWINPFANPDGSYRNGDPNVLSSPQRGNANGVDMNRNYIDPKGGPHPDGYSWQMETVAFMNFAGQHNFVISANHHGGAEVVNYPWDTWARLIVDDNWWVDISHQFADSAQKYSPSGYIDGFNDGITNGYAWYSIEGGRQDYMNYFHGCREVTLEISNTKFVSASSLPTYWTSLRVSLFDWLRQALFGFRGIVTDAVTSLPIDAQINVLSYDLEMDSSYVYTDRDVGDYHRMIEAGTYNVEYSSPGYFPDTVFGISVVDGTVQVVDVQLTPLPNEPVLVYDGNNSGKVDPGDNVSMNITLENLGAGNAYNVAGILTCIDTFITITQNTSTYPTISGLGGSGSSQTAYVFDVSASTPEEYAVQFVEHLTADGGYDDSITFTIIVGKVIEDFESGDFTSYPWQMSGSQAWQITTSNVYEGTYSAKSGGISHNQTSTMQVTLEDVQPGNISFFYKVSSEENYDYLRFYIDGAQKNQWSNEVGWAEATYPVTAGTHTFKWTYSKDGNTSDGSDCGWVDFISFPDVNSDRDNDGYDNDVDNCPDTYNPGQEDTDFDGFGDSCDNCIDVPNVDQLDSDSDGIGNQCDNCDFIPNTLQTDADNDKVGDPCDNCPDIYNRLQEDNDSDDVGNVCDNCPENANTTQDDIDTDEVGDVCDNCPNDVNTEQVDGDFDDIGDVCDNCPVDVNTDQINNDSDDLGDACDNCPDNTNFGQDDIDSDLIGDSCDNCIDTYNPDQLDANGNDIGDACEFVCGDVNDDGQVFVSDLVYLVNYVFKGGPAPVNLEAANVDGQPGILVSDLTLLVNYIFKGGAAPTCE